MGTWGIGTFENDDASDWVYDLERTRDLSLLRSTIAAVLAVDGYLEAPTCVNALAAAEVVAALSGKPAADLPEGVAKWANANAQLRSSELQSDSLAAIDRILGASELKELWDETDDAETWAASVRDLRSRLSSC